MYFSYLKYEEFVCGYIGGHTGWGVILWENICNKIFIS